MDPERFLGDLRHKPEALRALAARLRRANPWAFLERSSVKSRIVLLGMGSSAYAGGVAAARLRASGHIAACELASSSLLPRWEENTVFVAISATGGSRETLDAVRRLPPGAQLVALTNTAGSALEGAASRTVSMRAGTEDSGVACRSFQHTLVYLAALEAHLEGRDLGQLSDAVEKSAEASEHLLESADDWLPEVADLLVGPAGTHLAAPAHRLCSAQQGALMLREVPRRAAIACEVGDWAHVDVYLTKNTDYRLLHFAGSAWDDGVIEWTGPRRTTVVAVGGEIHGASATVRYPHDDEDAVRLFTETLVPELVAAHQWRRDGLAEGSSSSPADSAWPDARSRE